MKDQFVLDELEVVVAPPSASASCKSVTEIWDITVVYSVTTTVFLIQWP